MSLNEIAPENGTTTDKMYLPFVDRMKLEVIQQRCYDMHYYDVEPSRAILVQFLSHVL